MPFSPKLKIANLWQTTFGNWGSELRKTKFMTRDDFTIGLDGVWAPTITPDAGTYAVTVTLSRFYIRDGLIEVFFGCTGTTATAAATEIKIGLPSQYPVNDNDIGYSVMAGVIDDNASGWLSAATYITTDNSVGIARYDRVALTAPPVTVKLAFWGHYRV